MSKALVIKNNTFKNWIMKKVDKFINPEHPFMKFFGATDAFLGYSKDIDKLSFAATSLGFGSSLDVPFSPALPLENIALENDFGDETVKSNLYLLPEKTEDPIFYPQFEQKERNDQANNTSELEELLGLLDKSGFKVDEVKALPSGITKITVNELLGMNHGREPEFIRVRG